MKTQDWEKNAQERPEWTLTRFLLTMVVIISVVVAAVWVIRTIFYPVEQAGRIVEKTLDADNVIYNYEYFKSAYQDILAMDKKLMIAEGQLEAFAAAAGPRDKWDFRDKEEYGRLATNVTGIKNVRTDMVATYNARSKMANRSIFKGSDLPETID